MTYVFYDKIIIQFLYCVYDPCEDILANVNIKLKDVGMGGAKWSVLHKR